MDIEISLIIPCSTSIEELNNAAREAHSFFTRKFNLPFEIILVPNGEARSQLKPSKIQLPELESIRICNNCLTKGKGIAIRHGYELANGKFIFYTDADLPYDLSFLIEAYALLKNKNADLVTGNRRLLNSWFHVPTSQLHFVYRRHCFGLLFNFIVRKIFPINTTDTQAGIKGMTRELAHIFFKKLTCYGFLFDLELHLTASANQYVKKSLPVKFNLYREKSTVRIFGELFSSLYWLVKLKRLHLQGYYRHDNNAENHHALRPSHT